MLCSGNAKKNLATVEPLDQIDIKTRKFQQFHIVNNMKLVIFTAINKDENVECTSRLVCEEHDSPVRSLSAASVIGLKTV